MLIQLKKIIATYTIVSLSSLASGTYFLNVIADKKTSRLSKLYNSTSYEKHNDFFAIGIIGRILLAQVPQKMSYQAVIRDTNDQLAVFQIIGMKLSILLNSPSGTAVYVVTHTGNTNENGLFALEIGGGSVVSGFFSAISW